MAKSKLINFKTMCRVLGQLVLIESLMMLVCLGVSYYYNEEDHTPFIISLSITTAIGIMLKFLGLKSSKNVNRREAYLIVALTWVVFSSLGTIPLLLDGHCATLGTAFFESMSGFTTTGASVVPNVDLLPPSVVIWRSLMHWIGGLGIVFFTMTILPTSGSGDIRLFAAESTGLGQEKLHAKIKTTIGWIWTIYLVLTIGCMISLWACGMDLFHAINHAMSTISTGGFSSHSTGVQGYSSTLQYILIIFMFLGGTNFYLMYSVGTKRSFSPLKNNSELKFYTIMLLTVSAICALSLYFYSGYTLEESVRKALFNCVAINTTTGFIIDDYGTWFAPTCFLIMFLMFVGASSGSTSAGFKSIRMMILLKTVRIQFKRILHPNAVLPVHINKKPIHSGTEQNVMSLLFWFLAIIVAGSIVLMIIGIPGYDSCAISLASTCNIGTNFGHTFGPSQGLAQLPETAKWVCSFLMLAGRLEIFAILLPFTRSFWRRQ